MSPQNHSVFTDPTADEPTTRIQAEVNAALRALRDHQRSVASGHLFEAILIALKAEPNAMGRTALIKLGHQCLQVGFDDLALIALVEAIKQLEANDLHRSAGEIMVDVATVFARCSNFDEASYWNQRGLTASVETQHFANAAMASSNLAAIAFQNGDPAGAQAHATATLGYLERHSEPLANVESMTRGLLVQLALVLGGPAEETMAIARPLFGALREAGPSQLNQELTRKTLDEIARRHLAAHSDLDGDAWKRTQLPELWGGAS